MKKTALIIAATALAIPAAPAIASASSGAYGHTAERHSGQTYTKERKRKSRGKARGRVYDDRGRYVEARRVSHNDRVWRGRDGRYYCKRDNGTTGLVIGAGLGALAGSQVAGDGNRTIGAILGAVGGGVLGREVDRGSLSCR
ncbi:glycine zipper 2TM domain-containing protein [Sphingomonadaceae bacterium]|nr:glycine zipper 2TM domain-containing protein [Sphingomonadaceae bacterium]